MPDQKHTERHEAPMIGKIIEFSVKNKFLVVLLTAVLILGGVYAMYTIRLDAIPDLSDVQVIVFTEYPGQAPRVVEDQVTYPLTTTMLAVPYAKVVRGYSMFGYSFIYIIFEDGTDLYWARSRVLEYLSTVAGKLPPGVTPRLGPDATGVGWVYEYSLATGYYCPDHPSGVYHDPQTDHWYATPADAPEADRERAGLGAVLPRSRQVSRLGEDARSRRVRSGETAEPSGLVSPLRVDRGGWRGRSRQPGRVREAVPGGS